MTFAGYLKGKIKIISFFLIVLAFFWLVFFFCSLPVTIILYPTVLSVLVGLAFLLLDYRNTLNQHKELKQFLDNLQSKTIDSVEKLPEFRDLLMEDLREIIYKLSSEQRKKNVEAEKKYQDMIEYYTVWAHQIKTPISAMRLTLEQEDSAKGRILRSELFHIEQYVEMVLAFLRLDSESRDFVIKSYELDPLIRKTVRKFATEFIERKLSFLYEPVHKVLITDEKWLGFVLEQLLSNALKYTREGEIRIYMESEDVLCVEDTGIGIEPEDLPRVFEKGYTGYNGREDRNSSGIGLHLCKRICTNLGIGIRIESESGKGTRVLLDLNQNSYNFKE